MNLFISSFTSALLLVKMALLIQTFNKVSYSMSQMLRLSMLLIVCMYIQACFFEEAGQAAGGGASFAQDISPLLVTNCATVGCHDGETASGGLNLSLTEEQTPTDQFIVIESLDLIDTETPDQSSLLLQASNTDPLLNHTGGEVFAPDSPEYKQLLDWIVGGAINDDCTGVEHSFAVDVVPVLSSCTGVGCHDGTASPNLLDEPYQAALDYINLNQPTQSPLLQNALGQNQHGGGTIFSSANAADYRKIFCWIQEDNAQDN